MGLFEPHEKRSMKGDYPELSDIPEFQDLNDKELRLVWHYACVSSPFSDVGNRRERMRRSISQVFGTKIQEQLNNELLTGNYPEKFRAAFERMAKFDVGIRTAANDMAKRIFNNYRVIVDVPSQEIPDMSDDEKAAYVKLSSTISKDLPGLVNQIENGYGIKERGVDDIGGNIMDRLITEG
jgi:hypothetical protein